MRGPEGRRKTTRKGQSILYIHGSAKRRPPGLVNSVPALAYHFCLSLLAAFTQPGDHLLAEPCTSENGKGTSAGACQIDAFSILLEEGTGKEHHFQQQMTKRGYALPRKLCSPYSSGLKSLPLCEPTRREMCRKTSPHEY